MNPDLGTYYVRVEFKNGDGFIYRWDTGARYTRGLHNCSPLNALRTEPNWENADDVEHSIWYLFTEGNYCCDCNRQLLLDYAHQTQLPDEWEPSCGETIELLRLTMIRPDGSEKIIDL